MAWRRALTRGMVTVGLTGLLGAGCAPSVEKGVPIVVRNAPEPAAERETSANRKLARLAQSLKDVPGVDRAELCIVPGATLGLVHIRQMHYEPPTLYLRARNRVTDPVDNAITVNMLMSQEYEWMNKVQRDVHDILHYLATQQGLRSFYNEGFAWEPTRDEMYRAFLAPLKELRDADYFGPQEAQYVDELVRLALSDVDDSAIPPEQPQDWEESIYIPGGDLVAAFRDGIEILPVENSAYMEYLSSFGQEPPIQVAADDREDVFLDIVAQDLRDLAVVVLGGGHALGGPSSCPGVRLGDRYSDVDNLAVWNARDDTRFRPISLLEVTPTTYDIGVAAMRSARDEIEDLQAAQTEGDDRP